MYWLQLHVNYWIGIVSPDCSLIWHNIAQNKYVLVTITHQLLDKYYISSDCKLIWCIVVYNYSATIGYIEYILIAVQCSLQLHIKYCIYSVYLLQFNMVQYNTVLCQSCLQLHINYWIDIVSSDFSLI